MTIRILIADDQALIRGALTTLLTLESDIEVIAQVGSGADALAAVATLPIDVALLDVEMPEGDGLATAEKITALREAGEISTRSLIVTTFARPGYVDRAIAAGASGYIVKDAPPQQLADAIRRVHSGLKAIDPALAQAAKSIGPNPLTPREQAILRLILLGQDTHSVASTLYLSEGTVRNHLSSAIAKTQASTRLDAALTAQENGWL